VIGVKVECSKAEIAGVYLFERKVLRDGRGSFHEAFSRDVILEETGFDFQVSQVNTSVSNKGVLRGIHYKKFPPGQAKFVSVHHGSIIDVAIDLRRSSPTFGRYLAFELSAENNKGLLLGYGIGHAFLSLEDNTRVSYLCDSVFEPEIEFGISPFKASIDWVGLAEPYGVESFVVNEKDKQAVSLLSAGELLFD
jgi:dTDP-4-dehydrorhamnose 3,5-epimerase